jgi:hypothetical protein
VRSSHASAGKNNKTEKITAKLKNNKQKNGKK